MYHRPNLFTCATQITILKENVLMYAPKPTWYETYHQLAIKFYHLLTCSCALLNKRTGCLGCRSYSIRLIDTSCLVRANILGCAGLSKYV